MISNSTDPNAQNIVIVETFGQFIPRGYLNGRGDGECFIGS